MIPPSSASVSRQDLSRGHFTVLIHGRGEDEKLVGHLENVEIALIPPPLKINLQSPETAKRFIPRYNRQHNQSFIIWLVVDYCLKDK